MSRSAPALRLVLVRAALALLPLGLAREALAQRYRDDADGAETCRAIWREFGRTSWSDDVDAVYCEVRDLGVLPRRSTIAADGGENGGVRVRGERRSDARLRLVVQAQARSVDEARSLARRVTVDLDESPLRAEGTGQGAGGWRRSHVSATLVIDAPERSNLSLRVQNGPLDVEGVSGQMQLRATNGPIDVRNVGGDVTARAQNGPISVEIASSRWQGAGLDAEAQNGPVTLRVPRDFGAELEIGTRNGPIDIDFPLTLRRLSGRTIETTLGSGGPPVRAVTQNGPMSMRMLRE